MVVFFIRQQIPKFFEGGGPLLHGRGLYFTYDPKWSKLGATHPKGPNKIGMKNKKIQNMCETFFMGALKMQFLLFLCLFTRVPILLRKKTTEQITFLP